MSRLCYGIALKFLQKLEAVKMFLLAISETRDGLSLAIYR